MEYNCPNCKENLKSKWMKIKYHKISDGFTQFGFYHQCPYCLSLIERNQHQISKKLSVFLVVPSTLFANFVGQYLESFAINKTDARNLAFILAIIFAFSVIKYFMKKIPVDWPYWKLFLVASKPL